MFTLFSRDRRPRAGVFALAAFFAASIWMSCSTPGGAQQPGGRGSGGAFGPEPIVLDDHTGFESIFDGKTLKGWDGDPNFWRAENDAIVGETTGDRPLKMNTFMIWRGGQPRDFELKVEFRMNSTNSGIQYRSVELPDVGKWVMKGYQYDMDANNQYTGQLYEERGRGFLAMRGQSTYIQENKKPRVVSSLGEADQLKEFIKPNDWNQVHVIARGNILIHILNGHMMSVAIDDDNAKRSMGGLIGLQLHMGAPMKVEFRNFWLKKL